MIEILIGILLITSIAILFFQFQNKSNNTDVKFQSSLNEKIKHIHDGLGRNRDESNKTSKEKSSTSPPPIMELPDMIAIKQKRPRMKIANGSRNL